MALKDTWKEAGKGLGHSFRDLGKAIVKTAAYAADKADDWANSPDPEEGKTVPTTAE
ncbi:MAG: hypothetical protein J6X61_04075 [Clostridia bacterium]|nr:hypothetical protein [Clostridia bacterium]